MQRDFGELTPYKQIVWSVGDVTRYVREIFESDDLLQNLWVYGEVSNLSKPSSGHVYFTIKDANAALRCVIWKSTVARLKIIPTEGMAVELHGSIGVYEVAGQYQLYVDQLRPAGEGVLYQQFIRLKERLEQEGLFDQGRKRPIPTFPRQIGIVTSRSGAALRDILKTLQRRYPVVEVIISPSSVQGAEAPDQIVQALAFLNQNVKPDLILLARGGGSIEDLWAFNSENVARAIAASEAPIISGIGHETDFTIADFVSDLRAPTPTAAAELATPNRQDLLTDLKSSNTQLSLHLKQLLENLRASFSFIERRLAQNTPIRKIQTEQQRLDDYLSRAYIALKQSVELNKAVFQGLHNRLSALNPDAVLQRGYAIVKSESEGVITSIEQAQISDILAVHLWDGDLGVIVKKKMARHRMTNGKPD